MKSKLCFEQVQGLQAALQVDEVVTDEMNAWFERQGFDDPQHRKNWHAVLSQLR